MTPANALMSKCRVRHKDSDNQNENLVWKAEHKDKCKASYSGSSHVEKRLGSAVRMLKRKNKNIYAWNIPDRNMNI